MRAARHGRVCVLAVVRCETRPSSKVGTRAPPVQHLLRSGYQRGLHAFQGGQRHHGRFGAPEEENGGGGRGEATAGEPALATSLWGMLYADDAGVVSLSPEQPRKVMGGIAVVCAAFDLTASEASKTESACHYNTLRRAHHGFLTT